LCHPVLSVFGFPQKHFPSSASYYSSPPIPVFGKKLFWVCCSSGQLFPLPPLSNEPPYLHTLRARKQGSPPNVIVQYLVPGVPVPKQHGEKAGPNVGLLQNNRQGL